MSEQHRNNDTERKESASPETEAAINELRKMYEFRGDKEVSEFLRENSFLCDLLDEGHGEIKEHFKR